MIEKKRSKQDKKKKSTYRFLLFFFFLFKNVPVAAAGVDCSVFFLGKNTSGVQ